MVRVKSWKEAVDGHRKFWNDIVNKLEELRKCNTEVKDVQDIEYKVGKEGLSSRICDYVAYIMRLHGNKTDKHWCYEFCPFSEDSTSECLNHLYMNFIYANQIYGEGYFNKQVKIAKQIKDLPVSKNFLKMVKEYNLE